MSVKVTVRPVDESMSVLTEVMRHPLDPGYRQEAERRASSGATRLRLSRRIVIAVIAVLLGVTTTAAVVSLRAPEPAVLAARSLLEKEITQRTADTTALRKQNQELSDEIAELQASALAAQDPALLARLAQGEVAAGSTAVIGPGLRVTLTDAPADSTGVVAPDNMVQDVDLQVVVNALWAAGAESIAINGQRLTSLTAIRSAGSAILVDLVPLSQPYTLEAIGDPVTMQTRFARTPAAPRLAYLRTSLHMGAELAAENSLKLPGAGTPTLRYAVADDSGVTVSSSATGPSR